MNETATQANAPGVWTEAMREKLRTEYIEAREQRQLRELADELGVGIYSLYRQAHRMGLSRQIRRR